MRACVVLACLAACDGGDRADDGELGGHCYGNSTCNAGLACAAGRCIAADAAAPDAAPDTMALDAAVDGPSDASVDDAWQCNDDSEYEPNDTLGTAYPAYTILGSTVTYQNLAICPGGDKDTFKVELAQSSQNFEILIDYGDGASLRGELLNSGGIAIALSAATQTPRQARIFVPNLPSGTYYPRVLGAIPTVQNNYQIAFHVIIAP
jgi:hypothetical protein